MRSVFISLVLVNVAIAVWGLYLRDEPAPAIVAAPEKKELKAVHSVVPGNTVRIDGAVGNEPDVPSVGGSVSHDVASGAGVDGQDKTAGLKSAALCELVGPFESREVAGEYVERLSAIDILMTVHDLELSVGKNYWLYLEPLVSRREAMRKLTELQSLGVDSYVIPKGELANGISLGMFSNQELANRQRQVLEAKGLQLLVKEIDRTQIEVWGMLTAEEVEKMSELTWERILGEEKLYERRQNFCLAVAS